MNYNVNHFGKPVFNDPVSYTEASNKAKELRAARTASPDEEPVNIVFHQFPLNITAADLPAPTVAAVLADPSISYTLKCVIREWLERDTLDALNDAELLVAVFKHRNEVLTKQTAHTLTP